MSEQTAQSPTADAAPASTTEAGAGEETKALPATPVDVDTVQIVRERAYAFYEARGCIDGYALDDWLKAEAEAGAMQANSANEKPPVDA